VCALHVPDIIIKGATFYGSTNALCFLLDFCHAEATGQTLRLLEKYKHKLCNVHISNRAHRPFEAETPKLKTFLTKLQEYGYSGPITMELSPRCTNEQVLETKVIIEKIFNQELLVQGVSFIDYIKKLVGNNLKSIAQVRIALASFQRLQRLHLAS
jgi:hypothetical protein